MKETLNNEFKIKYDGQPHQIDANVFINSLLHTTSIIQEINYNLDSGKKIEIKIKALEKGSFLVHLAIDETSLDTLKNLLTRENITFACEIIGTFVALIMLKKHIKSDKSEVISTEGDQVIVKNSKNVTIKIDRRTYQMYNDNRNIRDHIEQHFETLNSDSSITGFEITDVKEKSLIRVPREEFPDLIINSQEILDNEKIIIEAAKLNIVRLSFEDNLKWEFYYRGNKIPAWVKDPEFYKLIDKGEPFAKGDVLEVELEIKQEFNEAVNTYINKSYVIKRIINHIPRNIQQKLDFNKEVDL